MTCPYYPNACVIEKYKLLREYFCEKEGLDCKHKNRLDNLAIEYDSESARLVDIGRKR